MRWWFRACALLLVPGAAAAHPIEPLLTGSPMPVARDWFAVDTGYGVLERGGQTAQSIPIALAAGIGGRAEISTATSIDAGQGSVGPIRVGAKILLLMEGARGIDLALAVHLGSDASLFGTLLAGRQLAPGFYLQLAAGVGGRNPPARPPLAQALALASEPRHPIAAPAAEGEVVLTGAAALQWAPRPRLIPTLEVHLERGFDGTGAGTDALVAPEVIYLIEMNHVAIKLAVPVGLYGPTEIGLLAQIGWQR